MKQSLLRGSVMQWWSSETVGCSPSLQLDVTTGYIMSINTTCGHITRHANSWWKKQTVSGMLYRLIAQDFTKLFLDSSSRHTYIFTSLWKQTLDECVLPYTSNLYYTSMKFVHSEYPFQLYTSAVKYKEWCGGGKKSFQSFLW